MLSFLGISQTSKSDFSYLEQFQTVPGVSCSAAPNAVKRQNLLKRPYCKLLRWRECEEGLQTSWCEDRETRKVWQKQKQLFQMSLINMKQLCVNSYYQRAVFLNSQGSQLNFWKGRMFQYFKYFKILHIFLLHQYTKHFLIGILGGGQNA